MNRSGKADGPSSRRAGSAESWGEEVLAALTSEEKVSLLSGMDSWRLPGIERLGIPSIIVSDGPSGVRGESFISGRSACFPCGTALAATWDPDLVASVAGALGRAARHLGVHVLLGPTLNLHRHPLGGRNFEFFSEDPELAGQMARAYVGGVQASNVACCAKHFVANESEFERRTISSEVDEDVLRELYLVPFEEAIRAGAWSLMTSYNKLGGTHTSEHPWLLTRLLRDEWGFDGTIMSDWYATHSTVDALMAGLDIEMPGPPRYRGRQLIEAWQAGAVPGEAVDGAVRRVLGLIARTAGAGPKRTEKDSADPDELRTLIRTAGARGMVLLKNDGILPLDGEQLRTVALLGPGADRGEFQAGGSAQLNPTHVAGVLPALTDALAPAQVRFERGCVLPDWPLTLSAPLVHSPGHGSGIAFEYLARCAPSGPLLAVEEASALKGTWVGPVVPGIANDEMLVRARAVLRSSDSGTHTLSAAGTGTIRVAVDGNLVIEHTVSVPSSAAWDLRLYAARASVTLAAGRNTEIVVEFAPASGNELTTFDVGLLPPDPPDLLDRAVALAREADIAVVVVGSPPGWETEGRDRPSMTLPGRQNELVERVASANRQTVVVVNAGSPCAMPWAENVAAIVQMWFPGQELGTSLADVLTGAVNPSGKLPTTFHRHESDAASAAYYPGHQGRAPYGERFSLGYRRRPGETVPAPLFPFGHGLSYSRFSLGPPRVAARGEGHAATYEITVPVTNCAGPAGREVVQLYISSGHPDRPALELKGFASIELGPGDTSDAVITIPRRKLRAWAENGWRPLAQPLTAHIGTSSELLPLRAVLPEV